jgi:V-type H+-transporting ATPase subunit D
LPAPPALPCPAGHSLLKKKADALSMRFRLILKRIVDTKEEMGRVMKVGRRLLGGQAASPGVDMRQRASGQGQGPPMPGRQMQEGMRAAKQCTLFRGATLCM